jgi:hypothetical protein
MNADIDFELTPAQWETLKALRTPVSEHRVTDRVALQDLIEFGLVTATDGCITITRRGRDVVLRGSPRLWDVAA